MASILSLRKMSEQEIEDLRQELRAHQRKPPLSVAKAPVVSEKRLRRSDCSLQEWTEYQRGLERGYDAKRRARRREEGSQLEAETRRARREAAARRTAPPPSENALDTVIAVMQALEKAANERETPATGALAELEQHLRQRVTRLKKTLDVPIY